MTEFMKFSGKVTHLSQKGLGVVKNDENGISYFVWGAWPGDVGVFESLDRELKNKRYSYAKIVEILNPSSDRVSVECSNIEFDGGGCTGCPWMIADYSSQLIQKKNRFIYAMKRVGFDLDENFCGEVWPSDKIFGYRNRFQIKTDGKVFGYINENNKEIVPIDNCPILNERCKELLKVCFDQLPNQNWSKSREKSFNIIDIDDELTKDDIKVNFKRPFKQGNDFQNQVMKDWLSKKLKKYDSPKKIAELFSGSGNFTQILSNNSSAKILTYECEKEAVNALKIRNFNNVNSYAVDLFKKGIWKKLKKYIEDVDTLFLDPPRAGLKNIDGFFTAFSNLKRVYYISCDPKSFARDAWVFKSKGFKIVDVELIDLFPHTPHVEIMSEIVKE